MHSREDIGPSPGSHRDRLWSERIPGDNHDDKKEPLLTAVGLPTKLQAYVTSNWSRPVGTGRPTRPSKFASQPSHHMSSVVGGLESRTHQNPFESILSWTSVNSASHGDENVNWFDSVSDTDLLRPQLMTKVVTRNPWEGKSQDGILNQDSKSQSSRIVQFGKQMKEMRQMFGIRKSSLGNACSASVLKTPITDQFRFSLSEKLEQFRSADMDDIKIENKEIGVISNKSSCSPSMASLKAELSSPKESVQPNRTDRCWTKPAWMRTTEQCTSVSNNHVKDDSVLTDSCEGSRMLIQKGTVCRVMQCLQSYAIFPCFLTNQHQTRVLMTQ